MESIQNLVEYYDELFPVTKTQYDFYAGLMEEFQKPVKFLTIGCGTGVMENYLAKQMTDVTGLETIKELLESATRKHRTQLMSLRFFKMSTIEMVRFLGKDFYNVISCLNDRIIFIHDKILLRKFFFDCKQLLAKDGKIILQLSNYNLYKNKSSSVLPEISSVRVSLSSKLEYVNDEEYALSRNIKTGSGKILPVYQKTSVYPIVPSEIEDFAKEAGFTSIEYFADFEKNPFTPQSPSMVVVIK
ncbi:MAG: class I SAM-dependent methyltransferase [Treponema sp.]|uniref:methyltransferase domain-containing protein n=1 Tax=Treponema sp. TaxID=166 RepID=UPI00298E9DA8|nr:methyltransferase domain-containing protein [Treponema sp.]MCQ2600922.1 class I SAM-dependent methyltransferase [Treponema sp.]